MSKSLLDLAKRLEETAASLDSEANRLSVNVAETILHDLVFVTPVDTSQALSNWQVSLDTPISNQEYLEPYYPGDAGSTRNASALAAYAVGRKMLQNKKPGQKIFISNVTPYIVGLNDGTISKQASGFVEAAVLLGRSVCKKFKFRFKR
jgi:hypothetical protein